MRKLSFFGGSGGTCAAEIYGGKSFWECRWKMRSDRGRFLKIFNEFKEKNW